MGKAGTWEYPDLKVEQILQIIEIIDTQFKGKASSLDAFAQALGHEHAKSGALFYKLADLRKYGVITPRGDIELTPLGDKIAHPNSTQERQEAIKEMVNNIAFFKKLYEVLGNKPADSNLHLTLQNMPFGLERKEAQENAPKIRNIYNKILPYLSKTEREIPQKAENMQSETITQSAYSPDNYYTADVEGIHLAIPKEPDKLELAKILIERWEKKLKEITQPEKEKKQKTN